MGALNIRRAHARVIRNGVPGEKIIKHLARVDLESFGDASGRFANNDGDGDGDGDGFQL